MPITKVETVQYITTDGTSFADVRAAQAHERKWLLEDILTQYATNGKIDVKEAARGLLADPRLSIIVKGELS